MSFAVDGVKRAAVGERLRVREIENAAERLRELRRRRIALDRAIAALERYERLPERAA